MEAKAYYSIDKHLSPVPILSLANPVHASSFHILKIHFNIILPFTPMFLSDLFPLGLATKPLYVQLLSTISATCPTHPILLDFTTSVIVGKYRTYSSFFTHLLLDMNIYLVLSAFTSRQISLLAATKASVFLFEYVWFESTYYHQKKPAADMYHLSIPPLRKISCIYQSVK